MKYVLLMFDEKSAVDLTPEERTAWLDFRDGATKMGTELAAHALKPAGTATGVRVREGRRITTDGPFVETKEQLGGFLVFDCDSLETALEIAANAPVAKTGRVEVRAVHEVD